VYGPGLRLAVLQPAGARWAPLQRLAALGLSDDQRNASDKAQSVPQEDTMLTRVVNIRSGQPFDLYIGRAMPRQGLRGSVWANPFRIDATCTREMAIEKYRLWLLEQRGLLKLIPQLRGKVLACWCAPEACHGDVLAELAHDHAVARSVDED
jgi:hypothetical protein